MKELPTFERRIPSDGSPDFDGDRVPVEPAYHECDSASNGRLYCKQPTSRHHRQSCKEKNRLKKPQPVPGLKDFAKGFGESIL
jgi:hypothetical protein